MKENQKSDERATLQQDFLPSTLALAPSRERVGSHDYPVEFAGDSGLQSEGFHVTYRVATDLGRVEV